jgi:hypothetical protein
LGYERLIVAFLAHADAIAHDRPDANFWAYLLLHRMIDRRPEKAWPLVVAIVQRAPDLAVLNNVAAGVLEYILCLRAPELIDRVEALARTDDQFRRALADVWGWTTMPADVRARIDRAVGRAPVNYDLKG